MPPVTIYDASLRTDSTPVGGSSWVGSDHGTMWWEDNYRFSYDAGDTNGHWTNQNIESGSAGRHDPPSDATRGNDPR